MSRQFIGPGPWMFFVRFEQGRGQTGVPKTWVPWLAPPDKKPAIETVVKMAYWQFASWCEDPVVGHGQNIMPGEPDEYELHSVDGGRITKFEEIIWESVTLPGGGTPVQRADTVLTWKNPATLIAQLRKRP